MRLWIQKSAAAACLLATGCSSAYVPRPSRRATLAIVDGDLAVVKDGHATSVGMFGGGLEDAVAEDPQAREHAQTFRDYTIAGFVLGILGAGATGGGVGLWVGNESGDRNDGLRAAGIGLTIGGVALSITGAIFQMAAQPHLFDAINIYNDSVDPGFVPGPGGYGPALPPAPGAYPPPPAVTAPGPPVAPPPPAALPPPTVAPPEPAPTPGEVPSPDEAPSPDPTPPAPTSPAPSPNP